MINEELILLVVCDGFICFFMGIVTAMIQRIRNESRISVILVKEKNLSTL